jgi:hypothetical protein
VTKKRDKLDRLLAEARIYAGRLHKPLSFSQSYDERLLTRLIAAVMRERERANTATTELDEERYHTGYLRDLLLKAQARIRELEKN